MILKIFLLIFVLALVGLFAIAYSFYRQLHRVVKRFDPNRQSRDNASAYDAGVKQDNGDTIVDQRSEEQRNRKVIKDDEGEYVDYES